MKMWIDQRTWLMAMMTLLSAGAARPAGAAEPAAAEPAAAGASAGTASASAGTASAGTAGAGTASAGSSEERPMRRFRPERNMVELGVFGGLSVFSRTHDFYDPATTPQESLRRPTAEFGLRVAYFPMRFLGVELEGSGLPARYTPGGSAFIYGFRGSAILQLPMYRVVPFLLGGYGLMGVSSAQSVAGKDVDPMGHYGAGVKYYINRYLAVRFDIRHLIAAQAAEQGDGTSHLQVLLGLSVTLGRAKAKADPAPAVQANPDRDGDGFLNEVDECPDEAGIAPKGCPDRDSDNDSFLDSIDVCPTVPGVAPDGCPPKDRDLDGFLDADDTCPDEPGVAPDGCPLRDIDGDGILDKDDRCVKDPETRNGFEDTDGCPDQLPAAVVKFTGVIRGIFFDFGKDSIRKQSTKTLDRAASLFKDYPELKVEISGHTDNVGKAEYNKDLSRRRAESVKRFLVDKGIDAGRVTTRGAGPDEPIADNAKPAGRAKNRRIEFKLKVD